MQFNLWLFLDVDSTNCSTKETITTKEKSTDDDVKIIILMDVLLRYRH